MAPLAKLFGDLALTNSHETCLRKQVIDAGRPGSVLHDFQVVLDFVGTDGVKASGKHNLLPINAIDELDQRLNRPLRLKLKRPQLKSHPYLMGLHLLLRASGLTRVEGSKTKTRLVVDPQVLEQWNGLNSTEQFFTLLEAWLLHGRDEMLGERGSRYDSYLQRCQFEWRATPQKGNSFDVSKAADVFLRYLYRDFYLAALMDLFGLMTILHPEQPVQPWCPAGMKHTPFGDAVMTLLCNWDFGDENVDLLDEEESLTGTLEFGRLQPLFEPYFPDLQQHLTLPDDDEEREGSFVFRIKLGSIWRRIAIADDCTLDDLAYAILDSVNFDNDHLYEFSYRDDFGRAVRVAHPYCDEAPYTDEVTVGSLPLRPGQSMTFVFDFGDYWQFDVELERIESRSKCAKPVRIIERKGKAPKQYADGDEW